MAAAANAIAFATVSPHSASYSGSFNPADADREQDAQGDYSEDESGAEQDPSKKRKRPMSVSCELCKQRKVKCDRGHPSCGWCNRNGQICEYKERKKPGLRAGYGRELEARLDRLESIIQTQQNTIAQLIQSSPLSSQAPETAVPEANMFANPPSMHAGEPRPDSQIQMVPRPDAFVAQTPGFQQYRNGFQQSPYQKTDTQPTGQSYFPASTPIESPALPQPDHSSPAVVSQDHDFPPYDLLYALADLYFKHVNTWCPILHRRSTLDALFGTSSLDEADRMLLHAIVATTLRFSSDVRLTKEKKDYHHALSKQRVLLYGLENSSVKALQALVILALDQVGISNGPPGWNLLAIITRSAVQLGLAIEPTSHIVSPRYPSIYTLRAMVLPDSNSWIEDESRRRLFWMVYILDRYATITTAFDFALDEKEIDRKLPCRDDFFSKNQPVETRWFRRDDRPERVVDKPENLGSFSYYVEIVCILSRIHQFLKKPVDIAALDDVERWQSEYRELDTVLNNWKFSLPRDYGNMTRLMDQSSGNKNLNCGWVMLHATYHTTVMRLHSSAAYPTHRSPIFMPSFAASQRCLTAVEQISSLCAHVRNHGMLNKLGPPFAFSVWVAARLMLVHSSTIDHQVNPNIHYFVNTLRELGACWNVADRYASLLQRVLDESVEAEQTAGATGSGERTTPSSVKILADMRRNAYDLDFLISRQPKPVSATNGGTVGSQPGRVPANELEYLDVFDFFNMPRLPVPTDNGSAGNGGSATVGQAYGAGADGGLTGTDYNNNVTNFMYDANADWFMKAQEEMRHGRKPWWRLGPPKVWRADQNSHGWRMGSLLEHAWRNQRRRAECCRLRLAIGDAEGKGTRGGSSGTGRRRDGIWATARESRLVSRSALQIPPSSSCLQRPRTSCHCCHIRCTALAAGRRLLLHLCLRLWGAGGRNRLGAQRKARGLHLMARAGRWLGHTPEARCWRTCSASVAVELVAAAGIAAQRNSPTVIRLDCLLQGAHPSPPVRTDDDRGCPCAGMAKRKRQQALWQAVRLRRPIPWYAAAAESVRVGEGCARPRGTLHEARPAVAEPRLAASSNRGSLRAVHQLRRPPCKASREANYEDRSCPQARAFQPHPWGAGRPLQASSRASCSVTMRTAFASPVKRYLQRHETFLPCSESSARCASKSSKDMLPASVYTTSMLLTPARYALVPLSPLPSLIVFLALYTSYDKGCPLAFCLCSDFPFCSGNLPANTFVIIQGYGTHPVELKTVYVGYACPSHAT
ncbi:hypothetical protein FH972_025193 [Carpinus fangiana]|uniref:Zn(2)-C6 fungal-type domain-containing protein n=1 Tax=Carpinus fangiana TaxID=176857 RepID=A0A5N6L0J2_9ROSI|nr:hypothetical protein FH972_025193 [Carpinus fangiana]